MLASLDREVRLEAIALSETATLVSLADAVLQSLDVQVTRGPAVGLLMVRVQEPSESLTFNFTEVTVSEAEVLAGEVRGYAMVLGRDPEKALAGAIIDAAIEVNHPHSRQIEVELRASVDREAARLAGEWANVAPSMVRFEEMHP